MGLRIRRRKFFEVVFFAQMRPTTTRTKKNHNDNDNCKDNNNVSGIDENK